MGRKCILRHTLSSLNQGLDTVDIATQLILGWAENCTLDLDHVFETIEHAIDCYSIAISYHKTGKVELIDIVDGITLAILPDESDSLGIGIARKATGIFDQGGDALIFAHLIEHGALDIARDTHQAIVRPDLNNIVVLKSDVTCQTTIEDILIDIDYRH